MSSWPTITGLVEETTIVVLRPGVFTSPGFRVKESKGGQRGGHRGGSAAPTKRSTSGSR
jgi:hypothetical protein